MPFAPGELQSDVGCKWHGTTSAAKVAEFRPDSAIASGREGEKNTEKHETDESGLQRMVGNRSFTCQSHVSIDIMDAVWGKVPILGWYFARVRGLESDASSLPHRSTPPVS